MNRRAFAVAAAFAAALAAGGAALARRAGSASATVEPGELHEEIVARAVVVPLAGTADVRPRLDGRVVRVLVREGAIVKAGDLLAEIAPESMEAELARREAERRALANTANVVASGARIEERRALEAELRGAEEQLALTRKQAARAQQLVASGALTTSQLDDATSASAIAEARVEGLRARLALATAGGRPEEVRAARASSAAAAAAVALAEQQLDETKLVAPIDGVVLTRRIDPGDTIVGAVAGTFPAAFELADAGRVELRVEVEEGDAMRIGVSLPVVVRLPGTSEALGQSSIERVGAQITRRTIGAFDASERGEGWVRTAWVPWDQGRRALPIGQRLEVTIELPARAIEARVPRTAVRVSDGHAQIEVESLLGWRSTRVELGAADATWVEIRGVPAGAVVRVER